MFEERIEQLKANSKPWCTVCNVHHSMDVPCIQNGKEVPVDDHKFYGPRKRTKKKRND